MRTATFRSHMSEYIGSDQGAWFRASGDKSSAMAQGPELKRWIHRRAISTLSLIHPLRLPKTQYRVAHKFSSMSSRRARPGFPSVAVVARCNKFLGWQSMRIQLSAVFSSPTCASGSAVSVR
jgi:hypothetical protein